MMQNRLALTFILLTVLIDAIGIGLIFPVMPDLIEEISGGTLAEAAIWGGVLATSYAVMQFLFGPIVGSLSDRYGRRPVLLVSLAVMAADYVVMALAGSIWLLLPARVVAGISAATYSTATAYIADITPPEQRGARFGLIGACFGVGFILGPLIGGLLSDIDTRAPFWAAAGLALANMVFGWFVLPETVTNATRRPFALARANPLGALRAITRLPGMARILACYLILAIAMNVYPSVWSYFGQARFGWDARKVGISLAIYGLAFAVGQATLVGPLIRRFGERRAAQYGMWVDITTLAALGVVTSGAAALVITPFTALGGVVTPALQAIASRSAPADAQGEVQGVLASLSAIALIVSPLVMTGTFGFFSSVSAPVYLPGAPFLLASVMMLGCWAVLSARPKSGAL
jgi:DHA1 family tetracycline resistance protein-like MFS transporter